MALWWLSVWLCGGSQCGFVVALSVALWWLSVWLCGGTQCCKTTFTQCGFFVLSCPSVASVRCPSVLSVIALPGLIGAVVRQAYLHWGLRGGGGGGGGGGGQHCLALIVAVSVSGHRPSVLRVITLAGLIVAIGTFLQC